MHRINMKFVKKLCLIIGLLILVILSLRPYRDRCVLAPTIQGLDFVSMNGVFLLDSANDVQRNDYVIHVPRTKHNYVKRDFVLGIPVYGQVPQDILFRNLDTIIKPLQLEYTSNENTFLVVIAVFSAEIGKKDKLKQRLEERYKTSLQNGKLEIVAPPDEIYHNIDSELSHLEFEFVSNNVLNAFLLDHCSLRGDYFVWLRDDVIAAENYTASVVRFTQNLKHNIWVSVALSSPGRIIGHLFQATTVQFIASMLLANLNKDPIEVVQLYKDTVFPPCSNLAHTIRPRCLQELAFVSLQHRPSVFDTVRIENVSTDENNLANWTVSRLSNYPLRHEARPWSDKAVYVNPPAVLSSDVATVGSGGTAHALNAVYSGLGGYWFGSRPAERSTVLFTFVPPVALEEFFLRSGHPDQKEAAPFNTGTYVDVLPLFPDHVIRHTKSRDDQTFHPTLLADGFITVGRFNDRGVAEGRVGSDFGKVRAARMRVTSQHYADVILRDVYFKVMLVPTFVTPCCSRMWPDPFSKGIPGVRVYNE